MRVQLTRPGAAEVRDERGGVAVIVGVLLVPLMIISAFVVDFGMAFAQARAFSTSADSSALAIVASKRQTINNSPNTPVTCRSIKDADAAMADTNPLKSTYIAKEQTDRNGPFAVNTSSGVNVTVVLQCLAADGVTSQDDGFLKATVTVNRAVPTTLGKMVGVATVNATKDGAAALGVARQVNGLFPLALCDSAADDIVAQATLAGQPYPLYKLDVNKVWKADCAGQTANGSGNWGWLNCGSGVSAVDIGQYISQGCQANLTLGGSPPTATIDGSPGNKINSGNVQGPLTAAIGKTYAFPVYDKISGNGSNTNYRIVGFIQLKFENFDNDGNIWVRYVSYSPVGDLSLLCGIGNINCTAYNAWAIGLIK